MYRRVYAHVLQVACLLVCWSFVCSAQDMARVDSLQRALNKAQADSGKVKILLSLADVYRPYLVTKEFAYANEALSLAEKAKWDEGIMQSEWLIGGAYHRVMGYNNAIQHYKRSMDAAIKLHDTERHAHCLEMMTRACFELKRTDDMLAYQKALMELRQHGGSAHDQSYEMNNYALRLSDAGRYNEALDYWRNTIAYTKANLDGIQRDMLLARILNTMSNTYVKTQQPDSALYFLRIARSLIEPTGNYFEKAYIISTICDVYESTRTYDSAEIYGEQTVRMGETLKNLDLQRHYCETLSRVYADDHKPALALLYHKKFDSLDNLITGRQEVVDQAMQLTKISMDHTEETNRLEKKALETIRRNQRAALIAVAVALLALIALTVFIYRNLRQKQKANETISRQAASLQQQNLEIDKALKEKEMLLRETHHRVKNNLQLISSLLELQAANIEDEGAKQALHRAQDRVLSIATVHSKLYGSSEDESIEFSAFVSDLFSRLDSAFGSGHAQVQFNNAIRPMQLPLGTVVLLGIILNELITNSFKHAFTGQVSPAIRISLETAEGVYILRYHDNGPGLGDGVFEAHTGSLGLYLIKRLSKQLKGSTAYKFESGSTFTIIFPRAAN